MWPPAIPGWRSAIQFVLAVLCGICLLRFATIPITSSYLWAQHSTPQSRSPAIAPSSQTSGGTTEPLPPSKAATQSVPDLQKGIEDAVSRAIGREQTLLDKLITLVGIYSTILSFLALATVLISRSDFKDQLQALSTKTDRLAADLEKQIGEIRKAAEKDVTDSTNSADKKVAELEAQVAREFPFISRLQDRVDALILKLEAKFPEDENWNRPKKDSWKLEERQQDALIDESQILAVSVVVLDDPKLVKLYLVLARSYLERFRTGQLTDSDAGRAYLYAGRAIGCDPQNSDAYLLRGVIAMARYDTATPAMKATIEYKDLFDQARTDLMQARTLNPLNMGAYYNLAWMSLSEGKPAEAIRISEELTADPSKFSRRDKERFFPDTYINLGCAVMREAQAATDPVQKKALEERVVAICTAGRDLILADIKSSSAMSNFRDSLQRELAAPAGEFQAIEPQLKSKLEALL